MNRLAWIFLTSAFSLQLAFQPILGVSSVLAQTDLSEDTEVSPEDLPAIDSASDVDSLFDLTWLLNSEGKLQLSPQDRAAIEEGRVDVRVTDYLIYLVKPVEEGGAGLPYIKAQRILKNYDTNGRGKFDRESLDSIGEEDEGIVSAHNTGQAVDISEVGRITCKLVERRHIGGSTTRFQSPKPIKVAWQSRDGIARHPTPRGPSLTEVAGTLGTDGIMQMLNESGEMDFLAEFGKGLRLEDVLLYVGANILMKELGSGSITSDPLADSVIRSLGASYLSKIIPNLPEGFGIAENDQDARVAIARAQIETLLGIPPGSLRGEGWREILSSAGKRTIENAAGLPTLFLDSHKLDDANGLETFKAALTALKKQDPAFGVIAGTIEKIQKNDTEGLIWAGVNVLADAFRLNDDQRKILESSVKSKTDPALSLDGLAIDRNVPTTTLVKLFSPNSATQNEAITELRDFGYTYLREAAVKGIPQQYRDLGNKVISDLLAGKSVNLGDLKDRLAAGVLSRELGITYGDAQDLAKGKFNSRTTGIFANFINKELELSGDNTLAPADIQSIIKSDGLAVLKKIGGAQADKIIGWNSGTGAKLIAGEIKLEEALQQVFGNTITDLLGLNEGTVIPLSGDLQSNYGYAIIEQRLGLPDGSLRDKANASSFSSNDLEIYFGADEEEREFTDIMLGLPIGTTEQFIQGKISTKDMVRRAADQNLVSIGVDQLWNYFDLDETLRIKTDEAQFILNTIRNWENAPLEDREKSLNFSVVLVGRFMDRQANFTKDTFLAFVTGDTEAGVKKLIAEGIRQLSGAIGLKIDDFDQDDLEDFAKLITKAFTGDLNGFEESAVVQSILEGTGIPKEYIQDAKNFINGNYRLALEHWSSAMWSEFANKYLPEGGKLSYTELRNAVDFEDTAAINASATSLYNQQTESNLTTEQFNNLPADQRQIYQQDARRNLMQQSRDNAKYKISDAFLHQAGVPIPKDFSRVMFSGTDAERTAMITSAVFTYLDPELAKLVPGYETGMLEKLYKGEISAKQVDSIVAATINQLDIGIGPFSSEFVKNFYQFVRSSNRQDFYSSPDYQSMWNYLDGWFSNTIGLNGLPDGFVKSIYFASQNGFDFNKSLVVDGKTVVPSLNDLGRDFVLSKATQWADKALGLPSGSAYQIYQAVNSIIAASRTLTAAHAAAQGVNVTVQALTGVSGAGDALVGSAQANLAKAQANLTVIAITIALNACQACQAFFGSVDQAIQAPPGFTNAAVAGAIAMAFGLGPTGLIIAAAIYLFGTYRVDYLCPIPPPDRYAITQFDPTYDQLDYNYGNFYEDPLKAVKATPAEGENPFDWDNGLPFKDGNDPKLWMAWSRYFTGALLEATMAYGEKQPAGKKPLQVITFRQANAEFFYPRLIGVFGPNVNENERIGLGFTQKSTKTTDWVHAAFGGYF